MSNIIKQLEQEQMKQDVPSFRPGDTVEVKVWVVEGSKNVCRHSRAWLSLSVTAVCTLHSLFARFLTAKVLSVYSRLTHLLLTASALNAVVPFVVLNCTTCVSVQVRQLVLKSV